MLIVQAVAQRMAEDLHDVKLNCPVQEIDWEGDSVRLCCANGDIHSADAVVLTVSLGVLKVTTKLQHLILPMTFFCSCSLSDVAVVDCCNLARCIM